MYVVIVQSPPLSISIFLSLSMQAASAPWIRELIAKIISSYIALAVNQGGRKRDVTVSVTMECHTVIWYSCLTDTVSRIVVPLCAGDPIAGMPQVFSYGFAVRKRLQTQEFDYLYMHKGAYDSRQEHINTEMFHPSIMTRYIRSSFGVVQYIYIYTRIHTYMCINIHIYIYMYVYICASICIHMCIHVCICACMYL